MIQIVSLIYPLIFAFAVLFFWREGLHRNAIRTTAFLLILDGLFGGFFTYIMYVNLKAAGIYVGGNVPLYKALIVGFTGILIGFFTFRECAWGKRAAIVFLAILFVPRILLNAGSVWGNITSGTSLGYPIWVIVLAILSHAVRGIPLAHLVWLDIASAKHRDNATTM